MLRSFLALALLAPLAPSQSVLYEYQGVGYLGSVVAGIGDVTGDGLADFVIGDAYSTPSYLEAHSGVDGSILYRIFSHTNSLGSVVAGVDLDQDGIGDLAVAGSALFSCYSGSSGALLFEVPGGAEDLDWIEDLDGDGLADLALVRSTGIELRSSFDGGLLGSIPGVSGVEIETLGDVNSDGDLEVAVVTTMYDLRVYSLPGGQELYHVDVDASLNDALDAVGDVNLDGTPDMLLGEPQHDRARLLSGLDGSTLFVLEPGPGLHNYFAEAVAAAGDVNLDGHPDLGVRSGSDGTYVFSGADGTRLYFLDEPSYYGWRLDFVGDVNGDGFPELISGNEQGGTFLGSGPGYANILSPCPLPVQRYCELTPNSAGAGARIAATGTASVALDDLVLQVTEAVPGQFGQFFYGPERDDVPFGEGHLCVSSGSLSLFRLGSPQLIDVAGQAQGPLDLVATGSPASGALAAGSLWHFQFWFRDPAGGGRGFNLSTAVSVTVCP